MLETTIKAEAADNVCDSAMDYDVKVEVLENVEQPEEAKFGANGPDAEESTPASEHRYNLRTRTKDVVPVYGSPDASADDDDESAHEDDLAADSSATKRYKCPKCNFRSDRRQTIDEHLTLHTGERPHSCEECDKRFRTKALLKDHMRTHSNDRPLRCRQCSFTTKDRAALYFHRRKHDGTLLKCTQEGCPFKTARPNRQHMMRHGRDVGRDPPFSCSKCQRGFVTRFELRRHMDAHKGRKLHKCKECNYSARTKELMQKHTTKCHSGKRRGTQEKQPVAKQEASQTPLNGTPTKHRFSRLNQLRLRNRSLKKNLKRFQCPICFHQFKCRHTIERHMVVHTKERSFKCDKCGQGFTEKGSLKVHMAVHSDERWYERTVPGCGAIGTEYGTGG
ncbi:hypothetical protein AAVH_12924 [Aphelenchoides avenae]|nr:hypothetical protein AAVH_12924 [Aphelenchus avenae]